MSPINQLIFSKSSSVQYPIPTANVIGFWSFSTSLNSNIGGYTSTVYNSAASIQSSVKKWSTYSGALEMQPIASSSSGLRLSSSSDWSWNGVNRTLEFWIYPISNGIVNVGRIYTMGDRQDNICNMLERNDTNSYLYLRTNSSFIQLSATMSQNSWHWVVLSKSGSQLKIFLNGTLIYTGSNGAGDGYTGDGNSFHLGCDYDTGYGAAPRYCVGAYYQDVVFYNSTQFHSLGSLTIPTSSATSRLV